MYWKLFLDDVRFPPRLDTGEIDSNWRIARTVDEAINMILVKGVPSFISFDHDLGAPENGTGMELAKWLVEYHQDKKLAPTFEFYVHSANPVGAENINSYLNNYKNFCSEN